VYAQFSVSHSVMTPAAIAAELVKVFGPDDRSVLERSEVLSANSEEWKKLVIYSTQGPTYRLACLPARNDELQVIVEPVREDVKRACQSVWSGLRQTLGGRKPRLQSAEVNDPVSGRVVITARTGFAVEARRQEILNLVVVGIATVIWLFIGAVTFAKTKRWELFGGGLPGLIGGLMGLALAVSGWTRGTLRWQE
jgi:hypothetical protein